MRRPSVIVTKDIHANQDQSHGDQKQRKIPKDVGKPEEQRIDTCHDLHLFGIGDPLHKWKKQETRQKQTKTCKEKSFRFLARKFKLCFFTYGKCQGVGIGIGINNIHRITTNGILKFDLTKSGKWMGDRRDCIVNPMKVRQCVVQDVD